MPSDLNLTHTIQVCHMRRITRNSPRRSLVLMYHQHVQIEWVKVNKIPDNPWPDAWLSFLSGTHFELCMSKCFFFHTMKVNMNYWSPQRGKHHISPLLYSNSSSTYWNLRHFLLRIFPSALALKSHSHFYTNNCRHLIQCLGGTVEFCMTDLSSVLSFP